MKCPVCGRSWNDSGINAYHCPYCGTALASVPSSTPTSTPKTSTTPLSDFDIVGDVLRAYLGKAADVVVPPGIRETGTVKPKGGAFMNNGSIRSVRFSHGIKRIGDNAFSGCTNLESVYLPEGLEEIGGNAFAGCSNLRTINFPEGLVQIGNSAFSDCRSLKNVVFPRSLKAIRFHAFFKCSGIQTISLPDGYCSASRNSFDLCQYEFEDCTGLKEVKLSSSLPGISDGMFKGCTALSKVNIPTKHKLTFIGRESFYGCTALTEFTIPKGVKSIHPHAFCNCLYLRKVVIPHSVMTIDSRDWSSTNTPFQNCTALYEIEYPRRFDLSVFQGSLYYDLHKKGRR